MGLAIVCMIRDAAVYFEDFRGRCETLAEYLPLRVILGENDSSDATPDLCERWGRDFPVTTINRSEGGPYYPSADIVDRWRHFSYVMNGVLDQLTEDDDEVLYVDPDLVWDPGMMVRLHDMRAEDGFDVLSPLAWSDRHSRPYDLWGTRRRGVPISASGPYWETVQSRGVIEVDSVACCNLMGGEWARVCRWGSADANVGWHREIRDKGGRIWLNLDEKVVHP